MFASWGQALAPWVGPATWLTVISVPLGLALNAWVGRRRLYRRNFAGVEEFADYRSFVGTRILEKLTLLAGALLLTLGVLSFSVALGGLLLRTPMNAAPQPGSVSNVQSPQMYLKQYAPEQYGKVAYLNRPLVEAEPDGSTSHTWEFVEVNGATAHVRNVTIKVNRDGSFVGLGFDTK